jgi:PAS domain S-box-containing protein
MRRIGNSPSGNFGLKFLSGPRVVSLLCLLIGWLWVFVSSRIAPGIAAAGEGRLPGLNIEGWVFVAVTSGLLYAVLLQNARKTAARRQQLEHLRIAQSTARVGSWEQDAETGEWSGSDTLFELFGLDRPPRRPPVDWFLQAVHPDDQQRVGEAFQDSLKPGAPPCDLTHRIIRPDTGQILFVHERCRHVRDAAGNVIRSTGIVQDITGMKQRETELQESRAILQAALDHSQTGIAIADAPNGKLRYVNRAGLLIGGLDEEQPVENIDIQKYVESWKMQNLDGTPCKEEEVPLARAILYGETCSREFILRRAAHDARRVWANAAPIRNRAGDIIAGIAVFMDVTEQRNAEADLEQNRKLLGDVVDAIPDMLWLKNADGVYLMCNHEFEHLVNSSREKIIGRTDYDLFPRKKADFYRINDLKALESKGPIINEESAEYAADGYSTWLETIKTPLYGRQGELVGVLGIGRNISRRRQALKESREKQEFLNLVLERSPVPMWIGSPTGTLLRANQALYSVLNLTPEQVVGKYNLLRDDNLKAPDVAEKISRALNEKQPVRFAVWWTAAEVQGVEFSGGDAMYIEVSIFPILGESGDVMHLVVQWVDLTDRKRAEENLASQRAGLEKEIQDRTCELRQMVNAMAGREIRMAELKEVIARLRAQLEEAGLIPAEQNRQADNEDETS